MSEIKVINSLEELNTAIDTNPNLIVQFSATWCGPCKMVSLHINDTQEKLKDKVTIVKVDISNNPEIAENMVFVVFLHLLILKTNQLFNKQLVYKHKNK